MSTDEMLTVYNTRKGYPLPETQVLKAPGGYRLRRDEMAEWRRLTDAVGVSRAHLVRALILRELGKWDRLGDDYIEDVRKVAAPG